MTTPGADAQCDADASAGVGYTYPLRSYNAPASTATDPGIAPGAPRFEAPASPSTCTANRDYIDWLDATCGASSMWHDLDSEGYPAVGR